jgi:hypothetical protein
MFLVSINLPHGWSLAIYGDNIIMGTLLFFIFLRVCNTEIITDGNCFVPHTSRLPCLKDVWELFLSLSSARAALSGPFDPRGPQMV